MGVDLLTQAHGIVCLFEMQVCESVKLKLLGKKVGTFARIQTLVVEALTESIVRILTPDRSIDVLREALAAKVCETLTKRTSLSATYKAGLNSVSVVAA